MQKIIKIITWIIGIVIGFMVVIAASVIIDRGMGVNRLDGITNTVIPNGSNPAIRAYVARPSGRPAFPVVIMVHEWWGLKAEITGKADALAKDGYIVVAPNLFRAIPPIGFPRRFGRSSIHRPLKSMVISMPCCSGSTINPTQTITRLPSWAFVLGVGLAVAL
jgi:carboxymethylenebutenolidase